MSNPDGGYNNGGFTYDNYATNYGDPEKGNYPPPPSYNNAVASAGQPPPPPGYYGPNGQPAVPQMQLQRGPPEKTGDPKYDRRRPCCPHQPGHWDMWLYIILTLLFLLCAGLLIGLGVDRCKPWFDVQDFVDGSCRIHKVFVDYSDRIDCSCGKNCHSSYPCLKTYVYLTPQGEEEEPDSNIWYQDEYEWSKGKCSYRPGGCDRSSSTNDRTVEKHADKWNENQVYDCLHDPKDYSDIIHHIDLTEEEVTAMLVVPSVFALISIIGFIIIFSLYGCVCITFLQICCKCKKR